MKREEGEERALPFSQLPFLLWSKATMVTHQGSDRTPSFPPHASAAVKMEHMSFSPPQGNRPATGRPLRWRLFPLPPIDKLPLNKSLTLRRRR